MQSRLGLRFVPFPGPSSSGDQVLGECSHPQVGCVSYRLPGPSHLVFWMYNWHAFSGVPCVSSEELISGCNIWQMSTVQNLKKSWLAMKLACSLVEDASLEPQLPPSSSGCSRLPVSRGGWASPQLASSAQSFVL